MYYGLNSVYPVIVQSVLLDNLLFVIALENKAEFVI